MATDISNATPIQTFRKMRIDWLLLLAIVPLVLAGLVTINSFTGESDLFTRQLIWIAISLVTFFVCAVIDFRFLRRTSVIVNLFVGACVLLLALFAFGSVSGGAQSWFRFGSVSFEPVDPIKLVLIMVLAKYFSKRHIEIANIRHIVVSGVYALIIFALVFFHPDFGSALIIFLIWFGMVLVSGISKRHIALVFCIAALVFAGLWTGVFKEYQKQRIVNFIHPLADIRGSGYNAYQSTISVGSGEMLGKGMGYGTQSRLKFLPEYQTDFVFAAFAEEWGFVVVLMVFFLFTVVIWRILVNAFYGATNFEILYGLGLAILFISHFVINVGMNIGLLPVTGITIPFLSYGGTHLLTEFAVLWVLMGMRRYARGAHKETMSNEFVGF